MRPAEECELFVAHHGDVLTGHKDAAGVGLRQAGHQVQQRAFAASAGTHDGEEPTGVHVQAHLAQGRHGGPGKAIALGNFLNDNRPHGGRG